MGNEAVDYSPGLPPTLIADLPTCLYGKGNQKLYKALESISTTQSKAQCLLLSPVYELEQQVIEALTAKPSPFPVYHIGHIKSTERGFRWEEDGGPVVWPIEAAVSSVGRRVLVALRVELHLGGGFRRGGGADIPDLLGPGDQQ